MTGIVLIGFSSVVDTGLVDVGGSWGFLLFALFTVVLAVLSFLITGCWTFFFELDTAVSTLIFLMVVELVVGAGEYGRFCGGDWRVTGSDHGAIWSDSVLDSFLLLVDIELLSRIFYDKRIYNENNFRY